MLIHTAARGGLVRVCGTSVPGLVLAANAVEAVVKTTRRGFGWFECREDEIPVLRAAHAVCECSFATWLWMARVGKLARPAAGETRGGG